MSYTFDGSAKKVLLAPGTTEIDLVDLHSRWKDWVLAGNAGYAPAFNAVGGDIPAIPLYLFTLNGWVIVPQSADHSLSITGGVLRASDDSDPFVDPAGSYKVRINRVEPGIAIGYSVNSASALTPQQAAQLLAILRNTGLIPGLF